jgi:hypothetical protein
MLGYVLSRHDLILQRSSNRSSDAESTWYTRAERFSDSTNAPQRAPKTMHTTTLNEPVTT